MDFIDFFSIDEPEEENEEQKKADEAQQKVEDEQEPQKEKAKKTSKKEKKETGKSIHAEQDASSKDNNKAKTKQAEQYEYPFSLYTEGHMVDISNYGFEDGQAYSPKQINDIMLRHRHYEFASEMTYQMIAEDNVLVATAKQYKKG